MRMNWTHPHDPDAKITKMKDGRTHLAHKAEHAIDLETAIVGVTVQDADDGETTTGVETLIEAAEPRETVRPDGEGIEEIVPSPLGLRPSPLGLLDHDDRSLPEVDQLAFRLHYRHLDVVAPGR
jgi:hypothetical protein